MMRNLVSYVRFIHGYLFMVFVAAFLIFAAGNIWGIDEEHLYLMLSVSSLGSLYYLIISVLIVIMLFYRRIRHRDLPFWGPLIITLLCSIPAAAIYAASESTSIFMQYVGGIVWD